MCRAACNIGQSSSGGAAGNAQGCGENDIGFIGMLYHRDTRLAHAMLRRIRAEARWTVGDNEPYAITDGSDYAIPIHGERRGIAHVEIEVRQDLVEEAKGQREWAERIAGWLRESIAEIV